MNQANLYIPEESLWWNLFVEEQNGAMLSEGSARPDGDAGIRKLFTNRVNVYIKLVILDSPPQSRSNAKQNWLLVVRHLKYGFLDMLVPRP